MSIVETRDNYNYNNTGDCLGKKSANHGGGVGGERKTKSEERKQQQQQKRSEDEFSLSRDHNHHGHFDNIMSSSSSSSPSFAKTECENNNGSVPGFDVFPASSYPPLVPAAAAVAANKGQWQGRDRPAGDENRMNRSFSGIREMNWEQMFERLVRFKEDNGHVLVPNRYKKDRALGTWVSTQRRQYQALLGKHTTGIKPTTMSPERVRRLELLGMVWKTKDPRQVPWESRFKQLVEFKNEHGHCAVPMHYKENNALANWVSAQRQEKKSSRGGNPSRLTADQICALDSIDFVWVAPRGISKTDRKRWHKGDDEEEEQNQLQLHQQSNHKDDDNEIPDSGSTCDGESKASSKVTESEYSVADKTKKREHEEQEMPSKKRRTQSEDGDRDGGRRTGTIAVSCVTHQEGESNEKKRVGFVSSLKEDDCETLGCLTLVCFHQSSVVEDDEERLPALLASSPTTTENVSDRQAHPSERKEPSHASTSCQDIMERNSTNNIVPREASSVIKNNNREDPSSVCRSGSNTQGEQHGGSSQSFSSTTAPEEGHRRRDHSTSPEDISVAPFAQTGQPAAAEAQSTIPTVLQNRQQSSRIWEYGPSARTSPMMLHSSSGFGSLSGALPIGITAPAFHPFPSLLGGGVDFLPSPQAFLSCLGQTLARRRQELNLEGTIRSSSALASLSMSTGARVNSVLLGAAEQIRRDALDFQLNRAHRRVNALNSLLLFNRGSAPASEPVNNADTSRAVEATHQPALRSRKNGDGKE